MIAPDSFVAGMDWLLERSVGRGMNGTTFGQYSFTDLYCADDVSLLSEMLELLVLVFSGGSCPAWVGSQLAKNDGPVTGSD